VLGADDDQLYGGDGDDTIGSEGGDDRLFGEAGSDTLFGGAGSDILHGGSGEDIATYDGNLSDYDVTVERGALRITLKSDSSNSDLLVNLEQVQFADQLFSVTTDETAKTVATLYQQVFGRQADLDGFQWWMNVVDRGISLGDITLNLLRSEEYQNATNTVFDALTEQQQLEELYHAVLGRDSDAEGLAFWSDQIENQGSSIELVAGGFAASLELQGQVLQQVDWDFSL